MPAVRRLLASLLLLAGCASPSVGDDDDDVTDAECAYPEGAVEPMELGEVLFPYRWPTSLSFAGEDRELALERVFCRTDDIDWSPFDVLLFVSFPSW